MPTAAWPANCQLIDQRLRIRLLPDGEAADASPRAYWDAAELRFKITSSPRPGIREFWCDEGSAVKDYGVDDTRKASSLTYAQESNWVWDYNDRATATNRGPTQVALTTPVTTPFIPPSSNPPVSPGSLELPASPGDPSGDIALNLGSGSATAEDGIALNLLSDDVSAGEGELALGVLGINLTLGGLGGSSGGGSGISTPAEGSGSGIELGLGSGTVTADDGIAANVGEGSTAATSGIAAGLGSGTSSAINGIGINLGSGSATAGSSGN